MPSEPKSDSISLLAAAGVGAALMYLLDPARGNRRRHRVADKLIHAGNVAEEAIGKTKRDVANHARGLGAMARSRFESDDADDVVIAERVRAELGRVVSHPGSIEVAVTDAQVVLSGPVLADEADALLSAVQGIRGVVGVEDHLSRHDQPGNVPGLQGVARPAYRKFELLQEHWMPAARFMTIVSGAALVAYSARRRDQNPLTALVGLGGLALVTRAATNQPLARLLGADAAGQAVAALFGRDPRRQVNDDLAQGKTTMESGRAPHDAAHAASVAP
jgi:hypothetical protein